MAHHLSGSGCRRLGQIAATWLGRRNQVLQTAPRPKFKLVKCLSVRHCSSDATTKSATSESGGTPFSDNIRVEQVVDRLTAKFAAENVSEPEASSQYLVSQVLGGQSRSAYLEHAGRALSQQEKDHLARLVECRLANIPIQYIAGNWDFRNIQLTVRPPVFIPRPETEQLVDIVLEDVEENSNVRILEIGPGSGNICLSLLTERPSVTVTAYERSLQAIQLTSENAQNLGVADRLTVEKRTVDMETTADDGDDGDASAAKFDLIVSNPPYVLRKDLLQLSPEIRLYEDLRALDGGAEGLDTILPILNLALQVLPSGGRIYLEVDPCHPHILPDHLIKQKFNQKLEILRVVKDFRQLDRFIVLSRV